MSGYIKQQQSALLRALLANAARGTCLFCERKPAVTAIFWATEAFSKQLGAAVGKNRVTAYALCSDHFRMPNKEKEVESKLLFLALTGQLYQDNSAANISLATMSGKAVQS